MITKLWYRINKYWFDKVGHKLVPDISPEVHSVVWPIEDPYYLRFTGKKLSVAQVDYALDMRRNTFDTFHRLVLKNMLVQEGLMEPGEVGAFDLDKEIRQHETNDYRNAAVLH